MAGFLVKDTLTVLTQNGECHIQLCLGDITKLQLKDKVDVILISAFQSDYSATPTSVIGALLRNLKINVRELSRDKEEDLRQLYQCWWSKPLPKDKPYKRLLCFETRTFGSRRPHELVGDVFRCLVPILNNHDGTVITPLLNTGDQGYGRAVMLKGMVEAAVNWMKAGLPLRKLKIVLYCRGDNDAALEASGAQQFSRVFKQFADLKDQYMMQDLTPKEVTINFDVYLSFSKHDVDFASIIKDKLHLKKADIRIFDSNQKIISDEVWQEDMYDVMIHSARVITVLTPNYLQSTSCIEQYNIALCCSRNANRNMLAPFYIKESSLPTYMTQVQYVDCRTSSDDRISDACHQIVLSFSVTLKAKPLMDPTIQYDIFISYSHCDSERANHIVEYLKALNPDLRLFFDMQELKTGGAWQRTLYHSIDGSRVMLALVSNKYLSSAVCQEEYNLALAKHCSEVGENSISTSTQCLCTHLTMFGSGFKIPINKIDLSDSAFLKLHENPVVFIFMVCCLCLYLLVIIWARKADKRDILKAGVTPLPDNDPRHHYQYEITVFTGLKRNAGTTATVFILIGGELGDSAPRILRDPKRKVFQKGGVDTFLLASPVSLGNLNHIRVWHDNQGKNPSWYLNRLMIKDLWTDRAFYFMANRWLAVEEGDGMIERVVPVAGRSELTSFGHLFYSKTRRNLSDGHIWFSVFTRPVKSKFTRVQRSTCCLSLLFCTMMANILFYGQDFQAMEGNQVVCRIGSISFTYGDIIIGVISSLMVFPINLIVVQMFRLSRPIPACPCFRKGQRAKGHLTKFRKLSTVSSMSGVSRAMSDLEKELARMESKSQIGSVPSISLKIYSQVNLQQPRMSADLENPTSATNSPREGNSDKTPIIGYKNNKKRKKGIELPWGCCVLAWVLVGMSVGLAFWLTIEVAGQFGKDKSLEWLMSMCFSLGQDIFLNQPIKVLFLGIFLSLIIRDPETEEANNANSSDIPLQDDEEYLHSRMTSEELQDPVKMAQLRNLKDEASSKRLAPLNSEELQEAREIRFKEIKMGKIIREIIFYLIFLNITMLICFGEHDPDTFHVHQSMKHMFVEARYNGRMRFTKIRGRENFWNYTENVFIPTLYSNSWYNGEPDLPGKTEHSLADKSMHLVGTARFRQLRVKHDVCTIPKTMINKTHDCRAPYSITDEEDEDFDEGWKAVNQSAKPNYKVPLLAVWKYHSWYNISSFPYVGKHALYNGGGYLADMGNTPEESLQVAAYLRQNMWVDQHTRALFMEFVVYNANINMYTTSFLLVEFLPQGGAMAFPYFWSIRLDRYSSSFGIFVLTGQVVYALFILYFLVREIRRILREKKAYFNSSWNGVEVCIITLSIASMVFYFYRMDVGNRLIEQKKKYPHMFLNFQYLVYWDQLYIYLSGFVLFLTTVKFLRLLRFNRRLLLFSFTLRRCSKDLAYYTVVFGVVFIAFALFAYALFHLHLSNFSTFVGTVETLFSTILGKFDFQDMISVNRILSPVFFFTYVVIIVFVMLSMFLSIINETFGKVRRDNKALENELEIVEFMMERFKRWSNFSERRLMKKQTKMYNYTEAVDPKDVECDQLRDKLTTMVDRLNQFIRSEKGMTGQKVEDRKIFLCP